MDCIKGMKLLDNECIDLVVTSPPYDNLRNYNNSSTWNFDIFKQVAEQLQRIIKPGGIIIWVVNDATINGSETGASFRQALYFKDIGLNINDTMIYQKENYMPYNHGVRYEQEFEYMFCFSKGKPKTFNPIKVPCKYAGTAHWGVMTYYNNGDDLIVKGNKNTINEEKNKGNIFSYKIGSTTESSKFQHPAIFPFDLAKDQIISWSNENDIVLDPFMGSGTTAVACLKTYRRYIGFEIDNNYYKIIDDRLWELNKQLKMV